VDDLPHGSGEYTWSDGHRYKGDYQFGVPEGRGEFQSVEGDVYEGEFRRGLPNGNGQYSYGQRVHKLYCGLLLV
jgi:hypothetical protein